MASINFYLKSGKTNKKGMLPIIVQITHNYKKYRKNICMVKPGDWNKRKQRVRINRSNEFNNDHQEINSLLDSYEAKVRAFLNETILFNYEITEEDLIHLLNGKDRTRNQTKPFLEAFKEFIETNKVTKAKNTIKGYTTVKNILEDYSKDNNEKLSFKKVDVSLFDRIKKYAYEEKDASDNYISKIAAVLKTFLNWSMDRNYYTGEEHKKFSAPEKEKDIVCLTIDELSKLYNHTFDTENLMLSRDIYCFGCFTGLRISDIKQLRSDHIVNGMIIKSIQKTTKTETIPLIKQAKDLIEKYRGHLTIFPSISEQKLNKHIKTCCQLAKIDTPITIVKFQGGKRKEETKPKYELITLHTARKTFVSNSLRLGLDHKTIKSITGHKKDASFNKYLKIENDFKKEKLNEAWNKIV
ncbi:tyrosine-type recombinase/integrase [Marinifilum fragile]|uniref:tyrosine-type recombinase/integrase n=1 Tax=Marinifilum fragile TaxID=570161 RepID=UPI002D1E3639|nr:tyrosine-type recombinase/integrase [Marinifilum fragile]